MATAAGIRTKLNFGLKPLPMILSLYLLQPLQHYAMLLPDPVNADTEDTFIIVAPKFS